MSIIRIGSNEKYAEGWDKAFGKGKKTTKSAAPKKKTAKKATKKKAAPKSAKKGAKKKS